jgi:hypothetical protein
MAPSPLIPGGVASTPSTTISNGPLVRGLAAIPDGWEQRSPFRIYRQPDVLPLLTNLASNQDMRDGPYANAEMYCLTQLYSDAHLADITTAIALGRALDPIMYVMPAGRVAVFDELDSYVTGVNIPFTFSRWVDRDYWVGMADLWKTRFIGLRHPSDPRIGLSTENYGTGSAEPTPSSLAAAGFTIEQFYDATEPFVDMLYRYGCVVYVGPIAGNSVAQFNLWLPRLVDALGARNVQGMWEVGGGYGQHENFRRFPKTSYFDDVREIACGLALYDAHYGPGTIHRISAADSKVRQWGLLAETLAVPTGSFGPYAPWVEYFNKSDTLLAGTPAYYVGTTLHSSNDVQFCWRFGPMVGATMPYSVGSGTSIQIGCYRSNVQNAINLGNGTSDHHAGSKLEPQGSDIYSVFRADCLPTAAGTVNNWTVFARFQIPLSLSEDCPLLSQADVNLATWQVYYDNTADAIKIEYSDGTTATLLANPERDTELQCLVSRSGNTQWYATMDGVRVSTSLGVTSTNFRYLLFGGGQEVATFPTNNTIQSCIGFVGIELRVWWRTLDATETLRQFTHPYPHV